MRPIDADALKQKLREPCEWCKYKGSLFCHHACEVNDVEEVIDSAPTIKGDNDHG